MVRSSRGLVIAVFGIAPVLFLSGAAPSQQVGSGTPPIHPVPFGPGERLEYNVRVGMFGRVGEGVMEVAGIDTIRGWPTYHLRFSVEGGVLFAKVDNVFDSWMDVSSLVSRRFEQDQKEIRTERYRKYEFFPEERRWERTDVEESGELPTDEPLDQVSFLYFVRTLPLKVGDTYTLDRYFQERGNPVIIKVVRKETVTVPAGTFETIVVQPTIQTRGLFGEGGRAEVYFTDDDRRMLVKMTSRMPVLRSLDLYLHSYTPGKQLTPAELASRPAH